MGVEEKLEKNDLLIYGKDEMKVHSDGRLHAEDYFCSYHLKDKKYVRAEVFWPTMLDMNSFPYCRECAEYMKLRSFLELDE